MFSMAVLGFLSESAALCPLLCRDLQMMISHLRSLCKSPAVSEEGMNVMGGAKQLLEINKNLEVF